MNQGWPFAANTDLDIVSQTANNMPFTDVAKKCSSAVQLSAPPDITELPFGRLDNDFNFEPIELCDFGDWNTAGSSVEVGGFTSPEPHIAGPGESPRPDAADHVRAHINTRAVPLSRHEARLVVNSLTGYDIHMQRDIDGTGALMHPLRCGGSRLVITKRPPVMRTTSSFNRDLKQGRIGATQRAVGISQVSLRAVHNQSIGQQIVAGVANDPGLESTTESLLECVQRLRV